MRAQAVALLIGLTFAGPFPAGTGAQTSTPQAPSAPAIAITFDDLPLNGPPLDLQRLQAMTTKLLAVVARHRLPVVGFVNESQLYVRGETDARIDLLRQWLDAGAELGNHTFSHPSFKGLPLAAYQDDVVRGDTVTRMLTKESGKPVRYFRHPFLQMGDTREVEESFERFLADRGYRIAPVTADTVDWLVLNAYNRARLVPDEKARVLSAYLKLADERLASSEKMAAELFGRPIRHILLLHANELNADAFEGMIERMTRRGYRFITLEEALADEAYRYPTAYSATSQWLSLWAASKGLRFRPPDVPEGLR